jgi:hypothetical protein
MQALAPEETLMPNPPRRDDQFIGVSDDAEPDVQGNQTGMSSAETVQPDAIARRAYERFQARGGEHGLDQEDWFEAERELKGTERG